MKKTHKDNWRVVAVVRPMATRMSIASLGFKDQWGEPLQGQVTGPNFEIVVEPGGRGWVEVGDWTFTRQNEGEKGCQEIRDGMIRHPNVIEARIECDSRDYCSHCDGTWEELGNNSEVYEFGQEDGLSIIGEPVCCEAAINEFRAERGIALCST